MQPEDERRFELVHEWLQIAEEDLDSARRLLEDQPLLRTSTYHSQQSFEKVLKAYLTYHQVRFPWTHNLEQLVVICAEIEPGFRELLPCAEYVSPFASAPRYPGDQIVLTPDDGHRAVSCSEFAFDFVRRRLPSDLNISW